MQFALSAATLISQEQVADSHNHKLGTTYTLPLDEVLSALDERDEAEASKPFFEMVDTWEIEEVVDGSGCVLAREYTNGVFAMHYDPRNRVVHMSVGHRDATSLAEGDDRELSVGIILSPDLPGYVFGKQVFTVTIAADGQRILQSSFDVAILDRLSEAHVVGFSHGTKAVQAFGLDGSSKAISVLKRCAFQVENLNPDDPFL